MRPLREALDAFEEAVLGKLLAGEDPVLAVLRSQARSARLRSRELTGAGFYLSFAVPPDAPALAVGDVWFGDVHAEIDGRKHGAGFILFVRGGQLDLLEGYAYDDEPWPTEIRGFSLTYEREPRDVSVLGGSAVGRRG